MRCCSVCATSLQSASRADGGHFCTARAARQFEEGEGQLEAGGVREEVGGGSS